MKKVKKELDQNVDKHEKVQCHDFFAQNFILMLAKQHGAFKGHRQLMYSTYYRPRLSVISIQMYNG
jgi:hypothetical protein